MGTITNDRRLSSNEELTIETRSSAFAYSNHEDETDSSLQRPSPRRPQPVLRAFTTTRRSFPALSVAPAYQNDPSISTNKDCSGNSNTTSKSPRLLGYDISSQRPSSATKKSRLHRFQNHRQQQQQQQQQHQQQSYTLLPSSSLIPATNDSDNTATKQSQASHKKGKYEEKHAICTTIL
ncbi:unnamed protein product [Absidia cylindrospora]